MQSKTPIAAAIMNFTRRAEIDPALMKHERLAYRAALVEQGVPIEHLVDDHLRDCAVFAAGMRPDISRTP